MNIVKILISLVLVAVLAVGLFIWAGVYNIAANDPHWPVTTEILELVRERSIEVRSEDLLPPKSLAPDLLADAATGYAEMCAQCHLAPGMDESELHDGLYPQPPVFYKGKHESHDEKETFWVIKNGIKLTGMPSWGGVHSNDEIWALVRFVGRLPGMTQQEYQKLTGEEPGHRENGGGHSHGGPADTEHAH
ncbi:MAG TPA: cytochrome c [Gammaproteobacteria bacterium]|nr:cytochrome c [Gammaproteobacteria bacterium]